MWKKFTVSLTYSDSDLTFLIEKFNTSIEAAGFLYEKLNAEKQPVRGDLIYREKYGAEPFYLDYDLKLSNDLFSWTLEGLYAEEDQLF